MSLFILERGTSYIYEIIVTEKKDRVVVQVRVKVSHTTQKALFYFCRIYITYNINSEELVFRQ